MAGTRSRASRAARPPHGDDFKLITGIGPAIESRLRRAGILTFAQLAALSPADLTALIPGLSAKRIAGQRWIGQARKRALKRKTLAVRQRYATFTVELLLDEDNSVRRTRVAHVQDGEEDTWAGWEDMRLMSFVAARAGLKPRLRQMAAQTATAELPTTSPTDSQSGESQADWRLEAVDMDLVETPTNGWPGRLTFERCMRAQINFQLLGASATPGIARPLRYFTQVIAYELATGQTTVLAAGQQQLRLDAVTHTTTVEFSPPKVGRYQLLGVVLLPENTTVGVALGPVLNVIP